jgi:hypothetical protein
MSKTPSTTSARVQSGGTLAAARVELSEVGAYDPAETVAKAMPFTAAPALPELDDEPAPLSESSEEDFFFAHDGNKSESLAPMVGNVGGDDIGFDEPVRVVSHADLDRRARLRKIVTGVVGGASLLAAFVMVKSIGWSHAQAATTSTALNSLGPTIASIDMSAPPAGATDQPSPVNDVPAAAAAPEPAPPAAEQLAAEVRIEVFDDPPESAQAPSKAAAAPPTSGAVAAPRAAPAPGTKLEARRLLASGKLKEAVSAARTALAADPTDAETYLLLGAALQDTGHWDESVIVFGSCMQNAKRGPLGDCRALSRR